MSIVTIVLSGKDFKLACSEESKDRLVMLSQKLDTEIKEMAAANQYASLELLLVMMALKHIDQRQSQMQVSGGEILESANLDFQKQLSSIFSELKALSIQLCKFIHKPLNIVLKSIFKFYQKMTHSFAPILKRHSPFCSDIINCQV